jgi:homocysteine S-methyltransferase
MPAPLSPLDRAEAGLVLDGGLASELELRGEDLADPLWSAKVLLERPERIAEVHDDYLAAGADVITTASYQASYEGFAARGMDRDKATKLMKKSVRLAEQARARVGTTRGRPHPPLVAASLGSYGASLADGSEFTGAFQGALTAAALTDWHRPRFETMATSGADLVAFETIPCVKEAEAIARLLEEAKGVFAWVSFSAKDERHVGSGEPFTACIAPFAGLANVVAVGVNCTAPVHVEGLLGSAAGAIARPFFVYPNAGEAWDPVKRAWIPGASPFDWAAAARAWWDLGARGIGGCCRTTPATIRTIAASLAPLIVPARPSVTLRR